jgi:hypothetical protein
MESSMIGKMRRRIFMPDQAEVTLERRGFQPTDEVRRVNLEHVGTVFLEGFGYGIEVPGLPAIESLLENVERDFRGFAYEGCGMALAVRDGIWPFGHRVEELLGGRGGNHIYMVYVGVGWAMARLPKVRWRAIMPSDDLLRWLLLDGYGFHQAYFRTKQYIDEQYQTVIPLWQPRDYANRAVDQGIGRALWFVNGSDVERVTAAIGRFEPARRADLWSGAGLASVYAGGADIGDIEEMVRLAGEYLPHAAQGAAFAAKARLLADLVTPGTERGVKAYCGMSIAEAAAVTDNALADLPDIGGSVPRYELWRQRIRDQFA